MKSIKEHLMFILPLVAILLGIEFSLVFNRVTHDYEEKLKANYSILVVSKRAISNEEFFSIDPQIADPKPIKKGSIAKEIAKNIGSVSTKEVLKSLPYFYTIHLSNYLSSEEVEHIRKKLLAYSYIKKVETFGESHSSKYNLFIFLKVIFWVFVSLISLVSIFLIIKQMEVWQMAHKERMQIMEVFGASVMLRSGVLFRMGIIDAIISTIISAGLFAGIKYKWADESGIDLLIEKKDILFTTQDLMMMIGVALVIVIIAVIIVTFSNREIRE